MIALSKNNYTNKMKSGGTEPQNLTEGEARGKF
jgi:hypothetical protein